MKYIRTKNKIIKERSQTAKSWIVKQADTIEELCDLFVIDFGKTNRITQRYSMFYEFEQARTEVNDRERNFYRYVNEDFIVYGTIWTDKGLIYVAKMNEKGELELL